MKLHLFVKGVSIFTGIATPLGVTAVSQSIYYTSCQKQNLFCYNYLRVKLCLTIFPLKNNKNAC